MTLSIKKINPFTFGKCHPELASSFISLIFLNSLNFPGLCQHSHIMNPNQSDVDLQPLSFVKHKLDPDKESVLLRPELEEQDPFGDESQAGVKYKTMAWW